MKITRLIIIFSFILIGIVSRLIPHPPNFQAINAIALVGAAYFGSRGLSFAMVLSAVFLSDCLLGFHTTVSYVYVSFCLITLIGHQVKNTLSIGTISLASVSASLLFFFVTNFGVWMVDSLYPKTLAGLGFCYTAAIPFLLNQMVGDLTYCVILMSIIYGCALMRKEEWQASKLH